MRWKTHDIEFLKNNYSIHGVYFCMNNLNRSKESIYSKAKEIGIKRNSIRITKKWSENDINYLIENYSNIGSKNCSLFLNKTINDITHKANSLGLTLNNKSWKEHYKNRGLLIRSNKVPYEKFLKFNTKEISYILGLIWGDGNLNIKHNRLSINMVQEDINELIAIFNKTGNWNISKPHKKYFNNRRVKNQITISTHNYKIINELINYDYHLKSTNSAIKLLKRLDDDQIKYFFRGYFDADGYISKSGNVIKFSGRYDHDWSYFDILNIYYKVYKYKNKQGKYSQLCIQKKSEYLKFVDLIYKNFDFGLSRKYRIYEEKNRNNILNK